MKAAPTNGFRTILFKMRYPCASWRDGISVLRQMHLIAPVILAALALWNPPLSWLRDGVIYVSPQGSNWHSGRSPDAAVATIQRAADMVAAGETILILPGVYREEVRVRHGGKPGKPVVFRAAHSGTVTISGAAPDEVVERLAWRHEGGKIWSAVTPWPVYHVIGDGENFYHVRWGVGIDDGKGDNVYHWVGTEGRVARLRELVSRPKAWGAFAWERGRLYIAFADGRPPRQHVLQINREIPRPYASWSIRAANVWVEASHVRFEGLRFHLGVGSGLLLWDAQHVVVRDALFTGAVSGISSFPRISLPRGLLVEHSHYNNYPQYFWARDWLGGAEIYSHHSSSTLVSTLGDGIVVRHNLVTHAGDGMQLSTPATPLESGIEVYGNLLANGTDDGFEFDGHAQRIHAHDNLVYNFGVSVSLSPVLTGPVRVRNNLFLHPPDRPVGAHLKLMNPRQGRSNAQAGPIRNVTVENNVFSGKWLSWHSAPVENVRVVNNVFADIIADARFDLPSAVAQVGNVSFKTEQGLDNPEAACRLRLAAGFSPPGTLKPERPGPLWLDYDKLPATHDVAGLARQWVHLTSGCG